MTYLLFFTTSFLLSLALTPLVKFLSGKFNILDIPRIDRKIHKKPIPLMGGVSIYLSFVLCLLFYIIFFKPDFKIVPLQFYYGIIFGGLVLIAGGILDDKFNLPPKLLWLFPAIASAIIVWSGIGIGITEISNPFGAPIKINYFIPLVFINLKLSIILVWLWMMGMIFTTKLLDGLDGLCSGIALIGGLALFALSLLPHINQPTTATLSIIFAGSLFGYLFYAFFPASVFLGEGGSTFLGFTLGVLSIILGGKIATALLVMGIPILDVAWSITRRIWQNKSPFVGDRKHLHFRLLDIGLSHKQAVILLYAISAIFGFSAIFLQSKGKLIALVILFILMLTLAISVVIIYKNRSILVKNSNEIDSLLTNIQNSDKL